MARLINRNFYSGGGGGGEAEKVGEERRSFDGMENVHHVLSTTFTFIFNRNQGTQNRLSTKTA